MRSSFADDDEVSDHGVDCLAIRSKLFEGHTRGVVQDDFDCLDDIGDAQLPASMRYE